MTPPLFNSQVHPQKQTPHLEVEQFGSLEWAVEPITLTESIFRHSGWTHRRRLLFDSLQRTGCRHRRLECFANCGALTTCEQTAGDVRARGSSCRHPLCEPCRQERAAKIRASLHALCYGKPIRFLTLTLRHSPTPLADQIDRLYRSFSVLRRRKDWIAHVVGGAAFLEVKLSERDGLWHPHLHVLIEGTFWDTREISREWHATTGDSTIVKITLPRQIEDVCRYAAGYCVKTVDPSIWAHAAKLDEAVKAIHGRRMCTTFGTWRGTPLEPVEPDDRVWVSLGRLDTVLQRAADGIEACQRWVEAAAKKYPRLYDMIPPPTPPPEAFSP